MTAATMTMRPLILAAVGAAALLQPVKADPAAEVRVTYSNGQFEPGEVNVPVDKPVVIRAKVVKFNGGIMGKNWIHLRDGSGSAADNSNDILVTSKDEAKVGDVVIAKGIVKTDVDLGSGYAYKVLVEDVSFRK